MHASLSKNENYAFCFLSGNYACISKLYVKRRGNIVKQSNQFLRKFYFYLFWILNSLEMNPNSLETFFFV